MTPDNRRAATPDRLSAPDTTRPPALKGSRYRTTMRCSFKLSGYTAMPPSQLVQAHVDREVEKEAAAAMKEARAGNLPQFEDVRSLLDDLHADD